MDDERRRILRMLQEGTISVEECEELLRAASREKSERVRTEVQAAQGKRPMWPYVMLVVLGVLVLLSLAAGFPMPWGLWNRSLGRMGFPNVFGPSLPFPMLMAPVAIGLLIFWIVMLVDCIKRPAYDFRLLFTSQHEHEKWIWVAVLVLAGWIGALVYLIAIRQARGAATAAGAAGNGEVAKVTGATAAPAPTEPYVPSRRARSLVWFIGIAVLLAVAPLVVFAVILGRHSPTWTVVASPRSFELGPSASPAAPMVDHGQAATWKLGLFPVGILVLWVVIFWVWMLIDCLVRDPRDFGATITSDKSLDKVLWLFLILLTSVIGALAYHIAVRRRRRPAPNPTPVGG